VRHRKPFGTFCPSPTAHRMSDGPHRAVQLGLRPAHRRTFVFRIEDTDAQRDTRKAIGRCSTRCAGSASIGTRARGRRTYGPYRQSHRLEIYRHMVAQLLEAGEAYYAFSTAEESSASSGRRP